ncbi:MAG: hypothetical protein Q9163_003192 [Psora crenata]
MALVEYSGSDSSDDEEYDTRPADTQPPTTSKKRNRSSSPVAESSLPPLPDTFHNLYASASRISNRDDPALHDGRQRQIPHVEEHAAVLRGVMDQVPNLGGSPHTKIHSLLESDLGAALPLHISLSRPMVLKGAQRQPFLALLDSRIRKSGMQPYVLCLLPCSHFGYADVAGNSFQVSTAGLDWVANHDHSRWFLVFRLNRAPNDSLNKLLRMANETAANFGQPALYECSVDGQNRHRKHKRPKGALQGQSARGIATGQTETGQASKEDLSDHFHLSVAWTLGCPSERPRVADIGKQVCLLDVSTVKVKIGNSVHAVALSPRRDISNGIL